MWNFSRISACGVGLYWQIFIHQLENIRLELASFFSMIIIPNMVIMQKKHSWLRHRHTLHSVRIS